MALDPRPSKPSRLPTFLTLEDVQALTQACSARSATGIRNRALIIVLYRQGLRLREALSLPPTAIDLVHNIVLVGGLHSRAIPLDRGTSEAVARWIHVRAGKGLANTPVLFCTLKGRALETAYVRQLLPRLARRAGLKKRVHAQALREACVAELARAG